jgi:folate-binding protein YgfZ
MTNRSPLAETFRNAGADLLPYGPPATGIELVESFGELDFEYAALRKACVLIDRPDRGTIEVTGPDAVSFLQSMITQDVAKIPVHGSASSFWLNKKGRIVADMRLTKLPADAGDDAGDVKLVIDLDAHTVASTIESLDAYLIMEEAEMADATERTHRFSLHGPNGPALIAAAGAHKAGSPIADLSDTAVCVYEIAGTPVVITRADTTGVAGLELAMPAESAHAVWDRLTEVGQIPADSDIHDLPDTPASKIKLRPAGWLAYNTARIEAGTPLFLIDFDTESLPGETGLLDSRVSFTKGCYLGQEIVARMYNLGAPKRRIVALKPGGEHLRTEDGHPRQPVGGTEVYQDAGPDGTPIGKPVGTVTSSTISPMNGGEPICLAMVKGDYAEPGTELFVHAEGAMLSGTVREGLSFLP